MISTKNGRVQIKGSLYKVLAEYALITRSVYEAFKEHIDEECVKELMEKSFALGFKKDKEVVKETLELMLKRLEEEETNEADSDKSN